MNAVMSSYLLPPTGDHWSHLSDPPLGQVRQLRGEFPLLRHRPPLCRRTLPGGQEAHGVLLLHHLR